jgi:hypothetical protein
MQSGRVPTCTQDFSNCQDTSSFEKQVRKLAEGLNLFYK